MREVVFAALLTACGYPALPDVPALMDATTISPDAPENPAFGTYIKVTFDSADNRPTAPLTISSNVDIDTQTSSMCDMHNDQMNTYCVVAGTDITIASAVTFRAHGSKALILLAVGTLDLQGTIDVSSKRGDNAGAGAPAACNGLVPPVGHSGGAGGSFGGTGGSGEDLDGAGTLETGGAAAPPVTSFPTMLRGGCPGGDGAMTGGKGGSGGGAVDIIAASVMMNGKIDASGTGGTGGPAMKSGGGGGGAGGMIVMDTRSITPGTADMWLFASGGGGGQGGTGTGTGNGAGKPGDDPADPTNPVHGGNDVTRVGGGGGDGTAGTTLNGEVGGLSGAEGDGGGGGGGGGAGFIRSLPITNAKFAPPATSP